MSLKDSNIFKYLSFLFFMEKLVFDLWGTLAYLKPGEDFGIAIAKELEIKKEDYHNLVKQFWFKKDISAEEFARILIEQTGKRHGSADYLTRQILSPYGRQALFPETRNALDRLAKAKELFLVSDTSSLGKKMFYELGISDFFKGVYFSCKEGLTKEEGLYYKVFDIMRVQPKDVVIIGDSLRSDYEIPLSLGSNALLLDRNGSFPEVKRISSLEDLK